MQVNMDAVQFQAVIQADWRDSAFAAADTHKFRRNPAQICRIDTFAQDSEMTAA